MTVHADIVQEVTRLFAKDPFWHRVISQNHELAKVFHLDTLIRSKDKQIMKIGINLGALMMAEVPSLELDEIVDDDFSMEKIN